MMNIFSETNDELEVHFIQTLILSPFIFYRIYKNSLYMYDTKNKKVYQFNNTAAKMIDIIGKNPGIAFNDFVSHCLNIIRSPNERIKRDAKDFTHALIEKDILVSPIGFKSAVNEKYINEESNETPFAQRVEQRQNIITGENRILTSAFLELTYKCNLKCVHCSVISSNTAQQELSTEEWFHVLDQLANANVLNITFTGGEVFARKDFLSLLDYAIYKRFLVDIYSNGVIITEEQIRHLAKKYINSFQTSLYGDTSELHDSITGEKGSFDKTLTTLKLFKNLGVSLVIKTVMMKQNASSCSGMMKIADKYGANFQIGLSVSQACNGDVTPTTFRIESFEQIKNIILERDKDFINKIPPKKDIKRSLCGAGFSGIGINPSGKIFMCNAINIPIGDVKCESIINVWNCSSELKRFRKKRTSERKECVKCKYLNYCQFCPGVALQDSGSLTAAYKEACFIAKARYETLK